MSIAHQILDYAMMKDGLIKRRELLEVLCSGTNGVSEKSIDVILNRMAANRLITRISHGTYLVLDEKQGSFILRMRQSAIYADI